MSSTVKLPTLYKIYDDIDRTCELCKGHLTRVAEKHLFKCKNCGTYFDAFVLTPTQEASYDILTEGKYSVAFVMGGKAGGKTFGNSVIMRDLIMKLTGDYKVAVGAITQKQNRVAYYELLKKIPDEWIRKDGRGKRKMNEPSAKGIGYIHLINGVIIEFIPTQNPGTIKSESYIFMWLLEITEGNRDFYVEVVYRSRGDMDLGMEAQAKGLILFETNSPEEDKTEQFFILEDFVYKSSAIYFSDEKIEAPDPELINPQYVTIIYDSDDNEENQSANFRERAFAHRSEDEINVHKKGLMMAAGRFVYPMATRCTKEVEGYMENTPWWASIDYGLSDNTVMAFFYINPLTCQITQFHEEVQTNLSLAQAIATYNNVISVHNLKKHFQFEDTIGCLKMFQRESDGTDIASKWSLNGVSLQKSPIFNVMPKVSLVKQLMSDNMFVFERSCPLSINEHRKYQFVKNKKTGKIEPQAKDDHTCEAVRNGMSILPIEVAEYDSISEGLRNEMLYTKLQQKVKIFMTRAKTRDANSGSAGVIRATSRIGTFNPMNFRGGRKW